jgi:hypothetical protein
MIFKLLFSIAAIVIVVNRIIDIIFNKIFKLNLDKFNFKPEISDNYEIRSYKEAERFEILHDWKMKQTGEYR